jgi:hypothetical protein
VRSVASAFWLAITLALASPAFAQAALAAAGVDAAQLPPESHLTLRPEPSLKVLATKIARVLLLRSDTRVEVGPAPPPDLLEAVPAGHVAMAREGSDVRLVMGAALGVSYEARVQVGADNELDPRSLALAIEALRDRAIETREEQEQAGDPPPPSAAWSAGMPATTPSAPAALPAATPDSAAVAQPRARAAQPAASAPTPRDEDIDDAAWPVEPNDPPPAKVVPRLFVRMYGGASPESKSLRTGVGTGGGLCVLGHCLLLAIDYPLPIELEPGGGDVRYRYPTFSCSFYSQPLHFGRFKPAVSLGLLSRIGHFERDMGIVDPQRGLETDLGVRATLEGAYALFEKVDLVAETGLDYALDRLQLGHGDSVAYRGQRVSPWLQVGVRVRPY